MPLQISTDDISIEKVIETSEKESEIKKALVDLYLSVKIRKNEEIDQYDEDKMKEERQEIIDEKISCLDII